MSEDIIQEAQVAHASFGVPDTEGKVQVNIEAVIGKLQGVIADQALRIAMLEVALAEASG